MGVRSVFAFLFARRNERGPPDTPTLFNIHIAIPTYRFHPRVSIALGFSIYQGTEGVSVRSHSATPSNSLMIPANKK